MSADEVSWDFDNSFRVRWVPYIDVRQLNPGAGELAKTRGELVYCGSIIGKAEARSDRLRQWRVRGGPAGCLEGLFRVLLDGEMKWVEGSKPMCPSCSDGSLPCEDFL